MAENYVCWKCGADISHLTFPLGRMDKCNHCNADLHVCKLCKFYDRSRANQCQEPVADPVSDKQRSNFCGYFEIKGNAYQQGDSSTIVQAQNELAAIFGEPVEIKSSADNDARSELEELFGSSTDGNNDETTEK